VSWDADLIDDRGHIEGDWNYTHNCNGMINQALRLSGYERPTEPGGTRLLSWWQCLNGMDGPAGAALLDRVIRQMEKDPDRFRAMNPDNGWGDYDSLVKVLTEMRNAVPEWPTTWSACG
jgi:hypothetical protein